MVDKLVLLPNGGKEVLRGLACAKRPYSHTRRSSGCWHHLGYRISLECAGRHDFLQIYTSIKNESVGVNPNDEVVRRQKALK
jgi:hypothetical protein